jgi:hypothetical protein
MHKAEAFLVVCAGIFLLALAYHFGAATATAQAPGNPVVGIAGASNNGCAQWEAITLASVRGCSVSRVLFVTLHGGMAA